MAWDRPGRRDHGEMSRLPAVLTPIDLPETELRAAALDGEVFAFLSAYCPIDEIDGAGNRALALARVLPPRVVAEQGTAAWVYGVCGAPPRPLQACTDITSRTKTVPRPGLTVREVVIGDHDIVRIGELRLTTTLRTVVDLARFQPEFGEAERAIVRGLAGLGGFGLDACVAAIDSRRNLPNKRRARVRLASSLAESGT